MGRRNRERRAAKQKDRVRAAAARSSGRSGPWGIGVDRAVRQQFLVDELLSASCECPGCADTPIERRVAILAGEVDSSRDLEDAAEIALARSVGVAWARGWQPLDLHELARRRLDGPAAALVAEAVLVEARQYAPAMVHPRWQESLRAVAGVVAPVADGPLVRQRVARSASGVIGELTMVVAVLGLLTSLPALEPLLPLPGTSRHRVAAGADVDEKALAKVRALLAKAESTEFPDEAEALSAKAQELMSRYALHAAVADHERGRAPSAGGRRMWIDAPYAGAKSLLVDAVAAANRCRAVWSEQLGFVTVVGGEAELDVVELLTTSLLVQANRAMLASGRQATRSGTSRTRSFRQSFLVAYGSRIRERLQSAGEQVLSEEADERLLPVLAARSRATEDATARLFPTTVERSLSVTNGAGWGAGRAAADLALLDVHGAIVG